MSAAVAILIPILQKVGAPILKSIIQRHVGGKGAEMAGDVIDVISGRIGTDATPEAIKDAYDSDPDGVAEAIRQAEVENGPALWAFQEKALDHQFELLMAETKAGGLKDAWRYGWMYLLGLFWIWQFFATATGKATLETPVLMQLTGLFLALYMGGHTLKELGKNAVEAARGRGSS